MKSNDEQIKENKITTTIIEKCGHAQEHQSVAGDEDV